MQSSIGSYKASTAESAERVAAPRCLPLPWLCVVLLRPSFGLPEMSAAAATAGPPDAGTKRKADDLGAVSEDDGDLDAPVLGGGGGAQQVGEARTRVPFH
eukprot:COSAG01_NODE_68_length_28978_cov_182.027777_20_plen_100_part_00